MRTICFLSDFGLADDFVGTCKGVIATIAPGANVIDLTHEVPGFDVEGGAEILRHATRYMPEGTVYLAVVDPGVGTERRALALGTDTGASLVGPDNGLLVPAAESLGGVVAAVHLTDTRYQLTPVSSTFHGRDVFAPVAAHLAAGRGLDEMGERVAPDSLARVEEPEFEKVEDFILARIMAVDRYGNARLSVLQEDAGLRYGDELTVDTGDGGMEVRYVETFGAAKSGELILVPDSHRRLSLSINKGNAAHALSLKVGSRVRLSPPEGDHG
jgi:S-adenosylmethionine hydrolase